MSSASARAANRWQSDTGPLSSSSCPKACERRPGGVCVPPGATALTLPLRGATAGPHADQQHHGRGDGRRARALDHERGGEQVGHRVVREGGGVPGRPLPAAAPRGHQGRRRHVSSRGARAGAASPHVEGPVPSRWSRGGARSAPRRIATSFWRTCTGIPLRRRSATRRGIARAFAPRCGRWGRRWKTLGSRRGATSRAPSERRTWRASQAYPRRLGASGGNGVA